MEVAEYLFEKNLGTCRDQSRPPLTFAAHFALSVCRDEGGSLARLGEGKVASLLLFFFAGFMMHDVYGSSGSSEVGGVKSHNT